MSSTSCEDLDDKRAPVKERA